MKFGITQGRLTNTKKNILQKFPTNWESEFEYLNETNLHYIELFLEKKFNPNNPIWNSNGQRKLKKLIGKTRLKSSIVCDNFIINKDLNSEKIVEYYRKLFLSLKKINCKLLIVPLEGINFKKKKEFNSVIKFIKIIHLMSKKMNIKLSLEFNEEFSIFKKIIKDTKINSLKITFDTGNFFLKNKNLIRTLNQYVNYVNHIHLKDRNKFGKNVILGTGLINFSKIMLFLKENRYKKCLTFETHRGKHAILTANQNLIKINSYT